MMLPETSKDTEAEPDTGATEICVPLIGDILFTNSVLINFYSVICLLRTYVTAAV